VAAKAERLEATDHQAVPGAVTAVAAVVQHLGLQQVLVVTVHFLAVVAQVVQDQKMAITLALAVLALAVSFVFGVGKRDLRFVGSKRCLHSAHCLGWRDRMAAA